MCMCIYAAEEHRQAIRPENNNGKNDDNDNNNGGNVDDNFDNNDIDASIYNKCACDGFVFFATLSAHPSSIAYIGLGKHFTKY